MLLYTKYVIWIGNIYSLQKPKKAKQRFLKFNFFFRNLFLEKYNLFMAGYQKRPRQGLRKKKIINSNRRIN